jgi:WD40 repeat protein
LTDVAFSPGGKKLAVSSIARYGELGGLDLWDLDYGRGIQTLRGLGNRVAQMTISPNDRLLAALDDDWKVGIWNLSSGRLLHVIEAPRGYSTDNAALAFSPNGDRLAFSTGKTAKLWDVESGKETRSWILSPGIGDQLAFDPTAKKLMLVRLETEKREALREVVWVTFTASGAYR